VNFTLADGSVRFIPTTIDPTILINLSSMAEGNITSWEE